MRMKLIKSLILKVGLSGLWGVFPLEQFTNLV